VPFKDTDSETHETVTLHFWDFGGQDIYHATHQFFLTKRSLYLFVWEVRREEETRSFDYWLNIVKLLSAESPVIVVMNKADLRTKYIDEAGFKAKFPNIQAFCQVSCLDNRGIGELTALIRGRLALMPHLRDKLPLAWADIRQRLEREKKKHNFIGREEYLAICQEYGLGRERAEFLSGYLHDLGVILHYRHDPLLRDTVILNTEWATEAVYALIDSREIQDNRGSFKFDDLQAYWDKQKYPPEKHAQLVRLMEKFELCFNFAGTPLHFVPELQPPRGDSPDISAYQEPGTLRFQYHYDFMPEGIVSRFMARVFYLIHEKKHFWKNGVELQFENSLALVQGEQLNRRLTIAVTGACKRELLAIIRSHFDYIHDTLNMENGVHYHEMVPCMCDKCLVAENPHLYRFEVLKRFVDKGLKQIQCQESGEQVLIDGLMKGYEPPPKLKDVTRPSINKELQLKCDFLDKELHPTGKRHFNTAGPINWEDHYFIDPLKRIDWELMTSLIEQKKYFVLHAPRQTGKTTYLKALACRLNENERYITLWVSFESAGYKSISVKEANDTLNYAIYQAAIEQLPGSFHPSDPREKSFQDLNDYLKDWVRSQSNPIVLFIDEIDALLNDVLVAILRQLRSGYPSRPENFPHAIVLVGLRDVRDYKVDNGNGSGSLGTSSPFNIKSESLFLPDFSEDEIFDLLEQHTQETGQVFPKEVQHEIYRLTRGQPWLTNALAYHIISRLLENDYSKPISLEIVNLAKNQLILRRDTHLDSLVDKLKEKRVKGIVQSIINGDPIPYDILDDDLAYIRDLGIVTDKAPLTFSNPIYAEIIPRVMTAIIEESLPGEIQAPFFIGPDGILNMDKVLTEFQEFYRRNAEAWLNRYEYRESAHQLLLMAFLQRIVNAGGEIIREMAVGNGRTDLLVKYKKLEFALEMKIKRNKNTIPEGQDQLLQYLDRLNLKQGYLVVFDPTEGDWESKISWKKISYKKKAITIVGL